MVTTITVSTAAQLVGALTSASNGDVIKLLSGTYSAINLRNININGNVTIESADPKAEATLTSLNVRDSSGLTFRNLEFYAKPGTQNPFQVNGGKDIVFDGLNVHGSMNGSPADDVAAMLIRSSQNVTVQNSEFQQLWHGIGYLDSTNVTITGNDFHDIRTDGVRGGGTSNLTISGNYFTDFYPSDGDHPDAIQVWTTNTTKSASNITITDNIILRGDGAPTQGIFLRDQVGNLPYQNVTITGNTLVGTGYNGIGVGHSNGVVIDNNEVVSIDGQESWIRLDLVDGATVSNNSAVRYLYNSTANVDKSDNIVTSALSLAKAQRLDSWVDAHDSGTPDAFAHGLHEQLDSLVDNIALTDADTLSAADVPVKTTTLTGTSGADQLKALDLGVYDLVGGAGNDSLTGNGHDTTMHGGTGDDSYMVTGKGDVVVELANEGTDTVSTSVDYTLGANVEILRMAKSDLIGHGNELDNRIIGSSGHDTMYGEGGADLIQGVDGDDLIYGGDGADDLRGDGGNDTLYGGDGNDKLGGGDGDDLLYGEAGNDQIRGGTGMDHFWGGAGADSFIFDKTDFSLGLTKSVKVIEDFSAREGDKISLSALDANIATAADDKFKFIGTGAFTKTAGELRYEVVNGSAYVYGDVDGDGRADISMVLTGVHAVSAADFVL